MEYQQFSKQDQVAAAKERQANLEQEHFNNLLALQEATQQNQQEEMQRLSDNIRVIEAAHAEVTAVIDEVPANSTNSSGKAPIIDPPLVEPQPEETV